MTELHPLAYHEDLHSSEAVDQVDRKAFFAAVALDRLKRFEIALRLSLDDLVTLFRSCHSIDHGRADQTLVDEVLAVRWSDSRWDAADDLVQSLADEL